MSIPQFCISHYENSYSGVYLMGDGEGNIIYVGQTTNFYERMRTFGEPDGFCLDDVWDIYLIKMDTKYCRGIEAVCIGIFQSYGNITKYRFYDKWVPWIVEKKKEEMDFNLAYYYSCHLPENQMLMQFIMSCKYKTFSRRVINGEVMGRIGGMDEWYSMDSQKAGWAQPLINLLVDHLQIGVKT